MPADAFLDDARIDVLALGDEALLTAHGELDMFSVARLRACLADAGSAARVIVDLARVTFADSAVLRCLSEVARERAASGTTLRVDNANGVVLRLMDLLRLDDLRAA